MSTAKIIDCTIRDGGLVNNWNFSIEFVSNLYEALDQAGIEYMEIGYKNAPGLVGDEDTGPWRFCREDLLTKTIPIKKRTKLSVMVDIGKFTLDDIPIAQDSLIDMIRVACYSSQIEEAITTVNVLHEKGYETCLNIMAVSNVDQVELKQKLRKVQHCSVDVVYIVDSFGSLYMEEIRRLAEIYKRMLPDKQIGIHAHNNLQLAFANTIAAEQAGSRFLDSTVYGMGRAAGNCPTELLIGYLQPKYDLKPVLKAIEESLIPLRKEMEWGYLIPYAISGQMNDHPRKAIALREKDELKDKYVAFYEQSKSMEENPLQAAK
ncbi:aldolase catalytic domain-containing protein [Pseudalkalibacillus sp. Hm43]|uniref:aldolase catalytic domain-containing protein n=1 Tax=Pseudalkalibacillus sp. Hm43 TaxID=3450742 RepID=UPI003F43CD4B